MNTVDALNVLGKALCGDSFDVKPGLTDAETILEIAKNYTGGGGGSGGNAKMIYLEQDYDTGEILTNLEPNLPMEYFLGAYFAVDDDERTPDRCEYNIVQKIEPELGGPSDEVIGYSMIFKSYSLSYYINDGHIVMPD